MPRQTFRLCAALAAAAVCAFFAGSAKAQLYTTEKNCVAGGSCCFGWPNSPDRVCGTLEEIQAAALRCELYQKSLVNPPWQLIHKCGNLRLAAQKIESIQRFNAEQAVEREQARKLLEQLNR